MKYTLQQPTIASIKIQQKEDGVFKAVIDYTVIGKAEHNGNTILINDGSSIEVDVPTSLIDEANATIAELISKTYISD